MQSSPASNSPAPQEESKRSQARGKMQNPGQYGEKGEVRQTASDAMEWNSPRDSWVPAVYHNNIREHLLAEASNNGARSYRFPREKGEAPFDETAFHPDQEMWDPDRANWDTIENDILHKIRRPDGKGKYADIALSSPWMWQGRVVVDRENQPLRKVPGLPVTISSNVEAWLCEAWDRIDARVTKRDVWQRLPDQVLKSGHLEPIYTPNKLSNDRFRKFRGREGLPAWDVRGREEWRQNYLLDRIPAAARQANSTRDVPPLTRDEKKELAALGEKNGKSLKKAQGRNTAAALETRQANSEQRTNQIAAATGNTDEAGSSNHSNLYAGSNLDTHGGTTIRSDEANPAGRTGGSWQNPQDLTDSPPLSSSLDSLPPDAGQTTNPSYTVTKTESQHTQRHPWQSLDAQAPSYSRQPHSSEQWQLRDSPHPAGQTSNSGLQPPSLQNHLHQDSLTQDGTPLIPSQGLADQANVRDIETSPPWHMSFEVNGHKFEGIAALKAARFTEQLIVEHIQKEQSESNQRNDRPPPRGEFRREESTLHTSSSLSSFNAIGGQQSTVGGVVGQSELAGASHPDNAGLSTLLAAHAGRPTVQHHDLEQRSITQPGVEQPTVRPSLNDSRAASASRSAPQTPGPRGFNIDFNAHITGTSVRQGDGTQRSTRRIHPLLPYQSSLPHGAGDMPSLFDNTVPLAQQPPLFDGSLNQSAPSASEGQRPFNQIGLQEPLQDGSFAREGQQMPTADNKYLSSSQLHPTHETQKCSEDNEHSVQQEFGDTRSSDIEIDPMIKISGQPSNSLPQAHPNIGSSNTQQPQMTSNNTTAGVKPDTTNPSRTDHLEGNATQDNEGDADPRSSIQDSSRLPDQDKLLESGAHQTTYVDSGLEFHEFNNEPVDWSEWMEEPTAPMPSLSATFNSGSDFTVDSSSIYPFQDFQDLRTMLEQARADYKASEEEQDRQDDINAAPLNPANKQARDSGYAMDNVATDPITDSAKKNFASSRDRYQSWQDPDLDPTLTDSLVPADEGMAAITPQPLVRPSQSRSLERQASHLPTPSTTGKKRKRVDDDDPEERQDPSSPSSGRKRARHDSPENVRGQSPPSSAGKKRAREEDSAQEELDGPPTKRHRAG